MAFFPSKRVTTTTTTNSPGKMPIKGDREISLSELLNSDKKIALSSTNSSTPRKKQMTVPTKQQRDIEEEEENEEEQHDPDVQEEDEEEQQDFGPEEIEDEQEQEQVQDQDQQNSAQEEEGEQEIDQQQMEDKEEGEPQEQPQADNRAPSRTNNSNNKAATSNRIDSGILYQNRIEYWGKLLLEYEDILKKGPKAKLKNDEHLTKFIVEKLQKGKATPTKSKFTDTCIASPGIPVIKGSKVVRTRDNLFWLHSATDNDPKNDKWYPVTIQIDDSKAPDFTIHIQSLKESEYPRFFPEAFAQNEDDVIKVPNKYVKTYKFEYYEGGETHQMAVPCVPESLYNKLLNKGSSTTDTPHKKIFKTPQTQNKDSKSTKKEKQQNTTTDDYVEEQQPSDETDDKMDIGENVQGENDDDNIDDPQDQDPHNELLKKNMKLNIDSTVNKRISSQKKSGKPLVVPPPPPKKQSNSTKTPNTKGNTTPQVTKKNVTTENNTSKNISPSSSSSSSSNKRQETNVKQPIKSSVPPPKGKIAKKSSSHSSVYDKEKILELAQRYARALDERNIEPHNIFGGKSEQDITKDRDCKVVLETLVALGFHIQEMEDQKPVIRNEDRDFTF